ncbi:hypothetical protein NEOLEDRAFT_1126105 [Neolentinus lepideus HHB14362 ss-1]|uniref:Uncharacterized protein n=1 Tax=Neolentinus lepideus HHB14362 ss-1 TaxID=1314782 RepID=A0A165W1T4_9AGAM|nr:hypothetical protein NEOLEDRAFT_1126105 [Neolentinus lepideus HHB14362 ss-1]
MRKSSFRPPGVGPKALRGINVTPLSASAPPRVDRTAPSPDHHPTSSKKETCWPELPFLCDQYVKASVENNASTASRTLIIQRWLSSCSPPSCTTDVCDDTAMSRQAIPGNYLQTNPVRGQLESYESTTRSGWRYLQCTDTPNELKVLLPPRTALLYANLIRREQAELAKGRTANWELIMRIRHLKERMIRKCMRLARVAPPKQSVTFKTLHAPPDFRLKELEKWFREERIPIVEDDAPPGRPVSQVTAPKTAPRSQRSSVRYSTRTGTPRPMSEALSYVEEGIPPTQEYEYAEPERSPTPLPPPPPPHVESYPERIDIPRPETIQMPIPETTQMPIPEIPNPPGEPVPVDIAAPLTDPLAHRGISRRRSSLKGANGLSRFSNGSVKSVAWAMDRDWLEQVAKYEDAIANLEGTGNEVEEIKASYQVQISEIRGMRQHISDGLARLQREVERLRLSEDMMRGLEERIRTNYDVLEEKQAEYQQNVNAMIEESKRVVELCDQKRTQQHL